MGKNVQRQVSAVQGAEKQPRSPPSVTPKNVVESATTELKPFPDTNPKRSPYVTKVVSKRQVENVTLVTPPSMSQANKEQGYVTKVPVSKGQQVKYATSVVTESFTRKQRKRKCKTG